MTNTAGSMPESIVAIADALGTGDASTSTTNAARFLGRLQRATHRVAQRLKSLERVYQINVRWFSDSIAMTTTLDDPSHLLDLLDNLAFVQAAFGLDGIFLRGAVTKGPHHHSEHIDFGPALTEAVLLERSLAVNVPRIVLSSSLHDHVRGFGAVTPPIAEDLADHTYFLDFIGSLEPSIRPTFRAQLDASYREALDTGKTRAMEKLAWLASYFNWRTCPPQPIQYALDHGFCDVSQT